MHYLSEGENRFANRTSAIDDFNGVVELHDSHSTQLLQTEAEQRPVVAT